MKTQDAKQAGRLARRYDRGRVGALLGIPFEQYVKSPGHYDSLARALRRGHGVCLLANEMAVVSMRRR